MAQTTGAIISSSSHSLRGKEGLFWLTLNKNIKSLCNSELIEVKPSMKNERRAKLGKEAGKDVVGGREGGKTKQSRGGGRK